MDIRKKVQKEEWQSRFQSFTSGNFGRISSINEEGKELVMKEKFKEISYDPKGKGNDIFISLEGYQHSITSPDDLFIEEDRNGKLTAIEIIGHKNRISRLSFEDG
ncbi:DUF5335 family protein [Algoriphagus halophilus]|uniref:Uncharacterized protein n=1 Tax=Algoriphagus halophilus TaxID=226505 RepID=A0A1N6DR88_9BACT|nr:DUF5335 family protein [Algoriphagus halophilus]SIN73302.1 hypothetical protein SAMN05444394_1294 [Algoriphagus halophilus]